MQTQKIIDLIVNWLIKYCRQAGMNGFVVGISGGIDSAVTSTLCAQTGLEVLALNLPIFEAKEQISLAEQHLSWLRKKYGQVKGTTVDLGHISQASEQTLPKEIQDDLTMANTRSRLRMVALYAFATHHSMLVTGTGNKVEDFGVGFFTKYGDGGVDISPIADLMKSEVYTLGKKMGILESIMEATPTDGLWTDSRSDQDQLGASYNELEWAMSFDLKDGQEELLTDRQREVLDIYRRLNQKNRHKTLPIPIAKIPDHLK
ncbi:MAG TPA: NAD(+) synthase [Desulfohalobiaceae bacterium]|nr:NAD(+) synthase [Desulfohalobiaceae bacterium]